MQSRALAFLLAALALFAVGCAQIWGFQVVTTSDDAGAQPDLDGATTRDASDGSSQVCAQLCNGKCPNLMTDSTNCGMCGVNCLSGTCTSGICACPGSQTMCGGQQTCVDITSDIRNCGGCGASCPPGASCRAGLCVCPSGELQCGSECFDLMNDSNHCGTCGTACLPGSYCLGGICHCLGTGTNLCSGVCVNKYYDPTNCVSCQTFCPAGVGCNAPMNGCTCAGATMMCPFHSILTCVNTNADPSNCGGCGNVCPAGADCVNGVCGCVPPVDFTLDTVSLCTLQAMGTPPVSKMACADLTADSNNCGTCGNKCAGGKHCQGGKCVF